MAIGLMALLVEFLLHPLPKLSKLALMTIGNIVCMEYTDQQQSQQDTPNGMPQRLHWQIEGSLEVGQIMLSNSSTQKTSPGRISVLVSKFTSSTSMKY